MKPFSLISGFLAGTIASLAFTVVHGIMISSIWFMLIPMLFVGGICGFFISLSYNLLVDEPTATGWIRYNLIYVVFLFCLGPISLVLFEPIMTIPVLLDSPNGLPD